MKEPTMDKCFAVESGKLHMACPFKDKTGIHTHVVIRNGYCYRSGQCMIVHCKFNSIQTDIDSLLSLIW
jgi:NAD-dependent dihydropyrimidine dehydrogenase PreA subunit